MHAHVCERVSETRPLDNREAFHVGFSETESTVGVVHYGRDYPADLHRFAGDKPTTTGDLRLRDGKKTWLP